jgi:hypothetical protein
VDGGIDMNTVEIEQAMEEIEIIPRKKSGTFLPMHLQFFADGGTGAADGAGDSEGGENDDDNSDGKEAGDQNQNKAGDNKTLTQAELNAMMKKEKDSGKRAILKELGLTDPKEIAKVKALLDSQKTEQEKKDEALTTAKNEAAEAKKEAAHLSNKFTAMGEGVKLEVVDDVIAIATLKVTETKDLKAVIAEMKTNAAYASFFTDGSSAGSSNGTGTGVGSGKKGGNGNGATTGLGSRLATANKPTTQAKSSYFSK